MKKFFSTLSLVFIAVLLVTANLWAAPPSRQARYIGFSNVQSDQMTISWINGNGGNRIVVVSPGSSTYDIDALGDGLDYTISSITANTTYGSGTNLNGGSGTNSYVVYKNSGSNRTVTVSGLTPGSTYTVLVLEYQWDGSTVDFNLEESTNNPRTKTMPLAPPTLYNTTDYSATSATVSWLRNENADGYVINVEANSNGDNDLDNGTWSEVYGDLDVGEDATTSTFTFVLDYLLMGRDHRWKVKLYVGSEYSEYSTDGFTGSFTPGQSPAFTTTDDPTAPSFSLVYYSDESLSTPLTGVTSGNNKIFVRGGTSYWAKITADEELSENPTINIDGDNSSSYTQGTDNGDVVGGTTNSIGSNAFSYERNLTAATSSVTFTGAQQENFYITAQDIAGNTVTDISATLTNSEFNQLYIDNAAPATAAISSATATAGTNVATYYNETNSGVNIDIPVPNDETLEDGTSKLQYELNYSTNWFDYPSASPASATHTVDVDELGSSYLVTLSDAEFTALVTESNTISFRVVRTDFAGNTSNASFTSASLTRDETKPVASTPTPSSNTITQADGGGMFYLSLPFDEPMMQSSSATVSFLTGEDPTTGGTLTVNSGSWSSNDTYEVWYGITDNNLEMADIDVIVTAAKDVPGNTVASTTFSNIFDVDMRQPLISSITTNISSATISDSDAGNDNFIVTVVFDEPMDETTDPTFAFPDENPGANLVSSSGSWTNSTSFEQYYNIVDNQAVISDIDIQVTNARDLAENVMASYTASNTFSIDMLQPTLTNLVRSAAYVKESLAGNDMFYLTLTFSESMDQGFNPSVTFTSDEQSMSLGSNSWTNETTFVQYYDITDNDDESANVDVEVTLGADLAGNVMALATASNTFSIDLLQPTITNLTVSSNTISESVTGSDAFWIDLTFSEPMNTGVNPSVTFTSDEQSMSLGSNNWDDATHFSQSFTVVDNDDESADIDVQVTLGQDVATNVMATSTTSNTFDIDLLKPIVSSITPSTATVTLANEDTDGFYLTVLFSEPMDMATTPSLTFTVAGEDPTTDGTLTPGSASWSDNTHFIQYYDVADFNLTMGAIDVVVTDAKDLALNTMASQTMSNEFDVDMTNPQVVPSLTVTITPVTSSVIEATSLLKFTMNFDENMNTSSTPVLTFPLSSFVYTISPGNSLWQDNNTYVAAYTITDNNIEENDIDVRIVSAEDHTGNPMDQYDEANVFDVDLKKPVLTSILPSVSTVNETHDGVDGFSIQLTFSEVMNTTNPAAPQISFPTANENPTSSIALSQNTASWTGNTIYTVYYTVDESTDLEMANIDVRITSAKDAAGNTMILSNISNTFSVDLKDPMYSSLTPSVSILNESNHGTDGFKLTAVFNEPMNTGISSTFTFPAENPLTSGALTTNSYSWTGNTIFEVYYNVNQATNLEMDNIDVQLSGFKDAAGNTITTVTASNTFSIDLKAPEYVSLTPSTSTVTEADNGPNFFITIAFDEAMNTSSSPTITFPEDDPTISGALSESSSTWLDNMTFKMIYEVAETTNVEFNNIDVRLAGFEDAAQNPIVDITISNTFSMDLKAPLLTDLVPSVSTITEANDGTGGFNILFTFDEQMNTAVAPTLTFLNPGVGAALSFNSTSWTDNMHMVMTYDVSSASNVEADDIDVQLEDVEDIAGNVIVSTGASNTFSIDLKAPALTDLMTSVPIVTEAQDGDLGFSMTFTFDEDMDTNIDPTVDFPSEDPTAPVAAIAETTMVWLDDFNLKVNYNVFMENDLEMDNIDVRISGAKDQIGNTITTTTVSNTFSVDTRQPMYSSLTPSTATVTEDNDGVTGFNITIVFDEPMNTSVSPTFTFPGGGGTVDPRNSGALSEFSTTWLNSTSYRLIYTVDEVTDLEMDNIDVGVTGFQDAAGNVIADITASSTFNVDLLQPVYTSLTVSSATINELLQQGGAPQFTITVDFSEAMDEAVFPDLTFSSATVTDALTLISEDWTDANTYVAGYSVEDLDIEVPGVDVIMNTAQDLAGNVMNEATASSTFNVDLVAPSITDFNPSTALITTENHGTEEFAVMISFDEAMDEATIPTISFNDDEDPTVSGALTLNAVSSDWFSNSEYSAVFDVDTTSNLEMDNIDIVVSGAKDLALNTMASTTSTDLFSIDVERPVLINLTTNVSTVNETHDGDNTFIVTLTYNEPMNESSTPVLTFSDVNIVGNGNLTLNGATSTWTNNTTYLAKYNVEETMNIESFDVDINITSAQDAAGNAMVSTDVSNTFSIDLRDPVMTSIVPNLSYVLVEHDGTDMFKLTLTFDEDMDEGTDPSITFTSGGEDPTLDNSLTLNSTSWSTSTVFEAYYDVDETTDLEMTNIDVDVSGAMDFAGNTMVTNVANDDLFSIDLQQPFVSGIVRNSATPQTTTRIIGETVIFDVTFNENVTITGNPGLYMNLDSRDAIRYAYFTNGASGTTLSATYTVVENDEENDLTYGVISFEGGDIRDDNNNPPTTSASFTTPGAAGFATANAIAVDAKRPTFTIQYWLDEGGTLNSLGNNPMLNTASASNVWLYVTTSETVASAPRLRINSQGDNNDVGLSSTVNFLPTTNPLRWKYNRQIIEDAASDGTVLSDLSVYAVDSHGNASLTDGSPAGGADPLNEATKADYVDAKSPEFVIQYYTDAALTNAMSNPPYLKEGTYYMKITASEDLSEDPKVRIEAQGSANDIPNAGNVDNTDNITGLTVYRYTRTIAATEVDGTVQEQITIYGRDGNSNVADYVAPNSSATYSAFNDTKAPSLTDPFVDPNSTTQWKGGNHNITWSSSAIFDESNSGNGIAANSLTFSYSYDSGTWTLIDADIENTDESLTWAVPSVSSITYTNSAYVRVNARDLAGNSSSYTLSDAFIIDNIPPTVTITRLPVTLGSFAGTTDNDITFAFEFSEPVTNFSFSDISVNLTGTANYGGSSFNSQSSISYTFSFSDVFGDGDIFVTLSSPSVTDLTDIAGNPLEDGTINSDHFTIDNTPPSVNSLTAYSDYAPHDDFAKDGATITIDLTTSEPLDEITTASIENNNIFDNVTNSSSTAWSAFWVVSGGLDVAASSFSFTVVDLAGNTNIFDDGDITGQNVEIDNTAPYVLSVTRSVVTNGANFRTNDDNVQWNYEMSEPINNSGSSDVYITGDGSATATAVYDFNWMTSTSFSYAASVNDGDGNVYFNLSSNAGSGSTQILDYAGNPMSADYGPAYPFTLDHTPALITGGSTVYFEGEGGSVMSKQSKVQDIGTYYYMDVTFDDGVYTNTNASGGLIPSDLTITFNANGGTATGASIQSVYQNDNNFEGAGSPLNGGETTVRVFFLVTGTPSGVETVEIGTSDNDVVYDNAGNGTPMSPTSGTYLIDDNTPPEIVNVEHDGTFEKVGNNVAINFDVYEQGEYSNDPTVVIKSTGGIAQVGNSATLSSVSLNSGTYTYTYIYTVPAGNDQPNGVYIQIDVADDHNNPDIYTADNQFVIDNTFPTQAAITVTALNGTVVDGYYNSTNNGFQLTVPIDNDASLEDGSFDVEYRINSGSWELVSQIDTYTIVNGDLGGNVVISINDNTFTTLVNEGENVEFRAVTTDRADNTVNGTTSSSTNRDETVPTQAAVTHTAVTGTVIANYYNSTNNSVSLTIPVANDATLEGGTFKVQFAINGGAYSDVAAIATHDILNANLGQNVAKSLTDAEFTALADEGDDIQFRALTTDIAGNSVNGTASSALTRDETIPTFTNIFDNKSYVKSGDVVSIIAEASELVNNPTVVIRDNADALTIGTNPAFQSSNSNSYTYSFTTPTGNFASVRIEANTTDLAGNTATEGVSTNAFTIDNTLPVVNITSPNASTRVNIKTIAYSITELNQGTNTGSADGATFVTFASGTAANQLGGWAGIGESNTFTATIRHTDLAGNIGTATRQFIKDATAPTVGSLSTTKADGSYNVGEVMIFKAVFNENVFQSGNPRLQFNTTETAYANYTSGSGSKTITFTYNVGNEEVADLDVVSISLANGLFKDEADNPYVSTGTELTGLDFDGTHAIIIDNTSPTFTTRTPEDDETEVALDQTLSIDFTENISLVNGTNITIHFANSVQNVFETYIIPSANVSVVNDILTINPTAEFECGTMYSVIMESGAVTDVAGNAFNGFGLLSDWNFESFTPPSTKSVTAGSSPYCNNDNITVNIALSEIGVTYEAYLDGTPTGNTANGNGGTVGININSASSGTYSVIGSNGVCETMMTGVVVVYPNPDPQSLTGLTNICENTQNEEYSVTDNAGSTYLWSVNVDATIDGANTNNSVVVDFGQNSVTLTLIETSAAGCSTTNEFEIDVHAYPSGNPIIGDVNVCDNEMDLTYSVTTDNSGSGYTYEWNVPAGATITSGTYTNEITVNWGTINGNVSVTETSPFGCETINSEFITRHPLPVANNISGDQNVCENESGVVYSATDNSNTMLWALSTGSITGGQGTDAITVDWGAAATATITLTETTAFGCSTVNTYEVTVHALPVADIMATDETICEGEEAVFTVDGGYANYEFFVEGASVQDGASNVYTNSSLTNTDKVWALVTSDQGCTAYTSSTITMTIFGLPTATLSPSSNSICDGTNVIFTAGGGANYSFYLNSGAAVQTGVDDTYDTQTLNNGDKVWVVATNAQGCTDMSSTITMTVYDIPVAAIASNSGTDVCTDESVTFTATPSGQDNYKFFLNDALVQNGTSDVYVNNSLTDQDKLYTMVTNNGCWDNSATLTMNVNTIPDNPGSISGTITVNRETNGVPYSITAVNGADDYLWNFSGNDVTINGTTNSVTLDFGTTATSGTLTVYAHNECGNSTNFAWLYITVNDAFAVPEFVDDPTDQTVCEDGTAQFVVSGVTGFPEPDLTWQINNEGWTNITLGGNYTVSNGGLTLNFANVQLAHDGGEYRLYASNSQGSTFTQSAFLFVNANETPSVSVAASSSTICDGDAVEFVATPTFGGSSPSYQWIKNGVDAGGPNSATWTTNTLADDDMVWVVLTSNYDCLTTETATSGTTTMTVNVGPSYSAQPSNQTVYQFESATFTASVTGTPTITYQWQMSTTNGISWSNLSNSSTISGATTNTLVLTDIPDTYNDYQFQLLSTNGCVSDEASNSATLTVNPVATKVVITSSLAGVESGTAFSIIVEAQDNNDIPRTVAVNTPIHLTGTSTNGFDYLEVASGDTVIHADQSSATFNVVLHSTNNDMNGAVGVVLTSDNDGGYELNSNETSSFNLLAEVPGVQAYNIVFTGGNAFNWNNGTDGTGTLILAKQGTTNISETPVDGNNYTASTNFGSGSPIGSAYVVFNNSTGNNITLSGLTSGQKYWYRLFRYNGVWTGEERNYLLPAGTNGHKSKVYTAKGLVEEDRFLNSDNQFVNSLDIQPNPAKDHITVNIDLSFEGNVTMTLLSLAGSELAKPVDNVLYQAGNHAIDIQLEKLNLASGTYILITTAGSDIIVDRFVIVK